MKIERAYKENLNEWEDVDEDTFLLRTEWAGVYKKGTALKLLQEKGVIETSVYLFRVKKGGVSGKKSGPDKASVAEEAPKKGTTK